jgi:hypothetical protein
MDKGSLENEDVTPIPLSWVEKKKVQNRISMQKVGKYERGISI